MFILGVVCRLIYQRLNSENLSKCPTLKLLFFLPLLQTNTESHEYEVHGINHKEGGWPKDVNCQEVEQVMRYRKKVEKDEGYIMAITSMGNVCMS